jgi:hypothetical protein
MSATHNYNATDYDDALLRLIDLAVNNNAIAVAINAGGTGYTVGDILTVSGGTVVSGLVLTLEVTSETGGVIDGIRIFDCGAYSSNPGNPVAVTGGTGGDDATFNMTFETQNWAVNRNVASSLSTIDNPTTSGAGGPQVLEREVQLQGPGNAGADEIYVGILEVRDTGVATFNWQLFGMTGFNGAFDLVDQPGFSYTSPNEIAAFVPLSSGAIECWFHVTPRVLSGVMRIGSTYESFYLGFLNPFATPTEFPYPLYIAGSSSRWNEAFGSSGPTQCGLADPGAWTGTAGNIRGPAGIRFFDGNWYDMKNWTFAGSNRFAEQDRCIYPGADLTPQSTEIAPADEFIASGVPHRWEGLIISTGNPGAPIHTLRETEDSAGDITHLVPTIAWFSQPSLQILGELDSVFWGSTAGNNIVSEDRVIIGGLYYRAFQSANRTDLFAHFFMREDA